MKRLLIVALLLLSGCQCAPRFCPTGYVPARHIVTHQAACFKGTWEQIPLMWEAMPEVRVR